MRLSALVLPLCLLATACDDTPSRPATTPAPAPTVSASASASVPAPATVPAAAAAAPAGPTVWTLDLGDPALRAKPLPAGAGWAAGPANGPALRVTVPAERAKGQAMVRFPVDLTPWRGCLVALSAQVRAEGVSQPPAAYNGIKVMLHWSSPSGGEHHINPNGLHGTFAWSEVRAVLAVEEDATAGDLQLGLQDSSGTVDIADVRLTALRRPPARRPLAAGAPPAYTGHDLPRLRGVMSPHTFKAEDFDTLAQWNVNLVRWQICRQWGKADTDRDLAEYDAWLDGKFAQLDQALEAARARGIRLVIDLHSPPGGRYRDKTMAMFCEKAYQDHFVAVWERIARRYKGHPAVWAYDLINEPVQDRVSPPGLLDWYDLQVRAARAVRAIDPDTAISIEVDASDSPQRFTWLTPVDVPKVIYQVHMYQPGEFTHQGVGNAWGEQGGAKPVAYPGSLRGRPLDRDALRAYLKPVRDFQLATNSHIYVGEFSAIRWATGADRYLADCIDLFEEYGWDWSYHAFREWGGWSVEHQDLPYSMKEHVLAPADQPTARAQVLWSWFARNLRPMAP